MMIKQAPSVRSTAAARVQPFTGSQLLRHSLRVRAAENNGVTATLPAQPMVAPEWHKDNESIKDVFAFAGPAPERVNGRLAMYGFAGIAFTEFTQHMPALEQFGQQWFTVVFFSILLTIASLLPKLASGLPVKQLHEQATSQNMSGPGWKQALALFDTSYELWTGRVAMIGVVGLVAAEVVKGSSLF